ncbi:MAG: PAS domain-containing protein [bacterium]|nr:PAS domain-containing protein [bacterium]
MTQNINEIKHLAKLLADFFAPVVETVIHDLKKDGYPIISIYNNALSNREEGQCSTVFGEHIDNLSEDSLIYLFELPNGKQFKSCSTIYRDKNGNPEFALSINMDLTHFQTISSIITNFTKLPSSFKAQAPDVNINANLELFMSILQETRMELGIPDTQISRSDQKRLVKALDKKNALDMYGGIKYLCEQYKISRTTIFNYRK